MADAAADLIMTGDVARELGVSSQAVYNLVDQGKLTYAMRTPAGYYLYLRHEVLRVAEERRKNPPKRGRRPRFNGGMQ